MLPRHTMLYFIAYPTLKLNVKYQNYPCKVTWRFCFSGVAYNISKGPQAQAQAQFVEPF